jgi:adenylosuccinate lyase
MIPRYSRPEMADLWSPETRYRIWFEIEAHAADAMAELGVIPKEAAGPRARMPVSTPIGSMRSSAPPSTT